MPSEGNNESLDPALLYTSTSSSGPTNTGDAERRFVLKMEKKSCGHMCYPSSTAGCCACMDQRPVLEGNVYESYVDGHGWVNTAPRDEGYCPVCNPKNYEVWERKIKKEHDDKVARSKKQEEEQKLSMKLAEEDRRRAAEDFCEKDLHGGDASGNAQRRFEYSNGDVYEGAMQGGAPSGWGSMRYANDGSEYVGEWVDGKHEGQGTQNWGDGIVYCGQWKNGMMHGRGKYTMACGTVVEGLFEENEWVD